MEDPHAIASLCNEAFCCCGIEGFGRICLCPVKWGMGTLGDFVKRLAFLKSLLGNYCCHCIFVALKQGFVLIWGGFADCVLEKFLESLVAYAALEKIISV